MEEIMSFRPRPPFLYDDVLILVASSRSIRSYGRLFLDAVERIHGVCALVQPEIRTLHQFLQKQYARMQAPRLIDENSRLVLLEGLVKECLSLTGLFRDKAELLAPSLSSVLAKMIEQLSAAEVSAEKLLQNVKGTEFFDKPQVTLLVDVYGRYEKALQKANLTDPAGMQSYLRDHFDAGWLSRYRRIIIDDLHPAAKLETEILKKISASADCTWLFHALPKNMVEDIPRFHPLTVITDILSSFGNAPESSGAAESDLLYLASTLFSGKSFSEAARAHPYPSSFSRDISLLSAVSIREEVSLIAGEIKSSLRRGTPPDSILVAFPALDEYSALVEEIFGDFGIPYNRSLGRQLSSSPAAGALVSLLRSCQEDYSGPSLLRVFSSPFLKFGTDPSLAPALDRLMRERAIPGGKNRLLFALQHYHSGETGKNILGGPLNDLFAALEPFSLRDASPLSVWMERLSALIAWSGLTDRVALIKGPLNINLQAFRKLNEMAVSLADAGRNFPDYRYTFPEWFFLLRKTFMHARFQVPPEDEGGVQIMGLEESLSNPWNEIYLGGLVDARFPQRLPQNIFLPEQTLEALGIRTLERARLNASYYFYRLLLSAEKVVLTYPENEGERPVVPSPFLEELSPLKKAGLLNRGRERTSGIQFSLRIEDSRSMPELAKAIGLAKDAGRAAQLLSSRGITGIPSPVRTEQDEFGMPSVVKRRFSVTELDAYLACPYDYYIINVLRVEPLLEASEDISPLQRGSSVHSILRNFYLSWNEPVTPENHEAARVLLRRLADSAFASEANTFRNRREKALFLNVMAERFLSAEIEFWKQGMKPVYLERTIEHYPLVLSDGREVELSAKIDRIDADGNGNFIIVDYKTGGYPLPKMGTEQEIFQLPVYAALAQKTLAHAGPHALRKPVGLAYYDLAGKTGAGARDVVLFNRDLTTAPCSKPKASAKSAGEFEAILQQSMDKAREAVERILAGGTNFAPSPQDGNRCRYCQNDVMCGLEKTNR